MTGDRSGDDRIRDWLLEEAPTDIPDVVLRTALDRTRATRRPRSLPVRRFSGMSRLLPVGIAAGVVLIAIVALLPRGQAPGVGGIATSPSLSASASPPSPSAAIASPSPSPTPTLQPVTLDGQVAYVSDEGGNAEIYIANLDRTGAVQLTSDPAPDNAPAWWPDGSRIVFARGTESNSDLWVMDADGGNQRQLTSGSGGETSPAVSPDGTRIAYTRTPGRPSIWVMNADGSGDMEVLAGPGFVGNPHWTPDGKALVVNVDVSSGGAITVSRLDLKTSELTTVVGGGGDNSGNAISGDGARIVFQGDRSPGGLFTATLDGDDITHLTGGATNGYVATWSTDSDWIAYQPPNKKVLFIIPSEGGDPVEWGPGMQPAWRP